MLKKIGPLNFRKTTSILAILFLVLSGCQINNQTPAPAETLAITPTIHNWFNFTAGAEIENAQNTPATGSNPTISRFFTLLDTSTPRPTNTPLPAQIIPRTSTPGEYIAYEVVYNDGFMPDWGLAENGEMQIDRLSEETVYQGRTAIQVKPQKDFGTMTFVMKPDSKRVLDRAKVIGVSLWLNGGDQPIGLSNLAFGVLGSNEFTYWLADDDSAYVDGKFPFSETRLYFLGFNNAIPPNTWVNVEIWMENLIFDPYYDYVTGFFVKNDEGYFNTFYIDEVSIMLQESGGNFTPTATIAAKIEDQQQGTIAVPDNATITNTVITSTSTTTRLPTLTLTPTTTRKPTWTSTATKLPTITRTPTRLPTLTSTTTKLPTVTATATPRP